PARFLPRPPPRRRRDRRVRGPPGGSRAAALVRPARDAHAGLRRAAPDAGTARLGEPYFRRAQSQGLDSHGTGPSCDGLGQRSGSPALFAAPHARAEIHLRPYAARQRAAHGEEMKSWFIRGALALAIVPALAAAQTGADNARPITIDDAVRLAVQYWPATVASRNSERSGEAGVKFARSQFLPSLTATYSANNQGGTQFIQGVPVPISGLPWTYQRGLSAGVTVFDGGRNWYNYKAAGATLDAAVASDVSQRYAVALSVKVQYYAILAAREQESAARRQLEEAQQSLQVASAKMQAGAATRADSLTAALSVGTAQLAILNAQNLLLNANAALTRLVASPVMVTAVAADTSDIGRMDVDEGSLTKMALEGPAVRSAAALFAASHATHQAATTPYIPSVTASGRYGQNPKAT